MYSELFSTIISTCVAVSAQHYFTLVIYKTAPCITVAHDKAITSANTDK